jgi:hypothetical protein
MAVLAARDRPARGSRARRRLLPAAPLLATPPPGAALSLRPGNRSGSVSRVVAGPSDFAAVRGSGGGGNKINT